MIANNYLRGEQLRKQLPVSATTHNRSPRPFVRDSNNHHRNNHDHHPQSGYGTTQCDENYNALRREERLGWRANPPQPSFMLGGKALSRCSRSSPSGHHIHLEYPTSTVHKSMLSSQQPPLVAATDRPGDENSAVYSRLISGPTRRPDAQVAVEHRPQVCRCFVQPGDRVDLSPPPSAADRPRQQQPVNSGDARAPPGHLSRQVERPRGDNDDQHAIRSAGDVIAANWRRPICHHHRRHLRDRWGAEVSSGRSGVQPDDKRDDYMWSRNVERASIAHQTYRTLPIVGPKPKALHDLPAGTYMRFNHDPTWELSSRRAQSMDYARRDHDQRIERAINVTADDGNLVQRVKSSRSNEAATRGDETSGVAFNYREYIDATRHAAD